LKKKKIEKIKPGKIKLGPVAQLIALFDKPKNSLRQPPLKRVMSSTVAGETATSKFEAPKYDDGKLMFELLMPGPLRQVVAVLTYGAKKYEANSYRCGLKWSRYVGAALRHIWAWYGGEEYDPESGLHHLAHAICCLLFLLDFVDIKPEFDNRPADAPFKRGGAEKYDKKHGWIP